MLLRRRWVARSTSSEGHHSGNAFAGTSLFLSWMENRVWTALTYHFHRTFAPRCPCIDLSKFCWQNLDFKQNKSRPVRAAGITGSPSLQFVLTVALRDLYMRLWRELLDRVIYKTMYGNPLDFSKIHDIVMNNEIKLTYLLFSVYLSALCSLGPFGAILSDLSTVRFPQVKENWRLVTRFQTHLHSKRSKSSSFTSNHTKILPTHLWTISLNSTILLWVDTHAV